MITNHTDSKASWSSWSSYVLFDRPNTPSNWFHRGKANRCPLVTESRAPCRFWWSSLSCPKSVRLKLWPCLWEEKRMQLEGQVPKCSLYPVKYTRRLKDTKISPVFTLLARNCFTMNRNSRWATKMSPTGVHRLKNPLDRVNWLKSRRNPKVLLFFRNCPSR